MLSSHACTAAAMQDSKPFASDTLLRETQDQDCDTSFALALSTMLTIGQTVFMQSVSTHACIYAYTSMLSSYACRAAAMQDTKPFASDTLTSKTHKQKLDTSLMLALSTMVHSEEPCVFYVHAIYVDTHMYLRIYVDAQLSCVYSCCNARHKASWYTIIMTRSQARRTNKSLTQAWRWFSAPW
jgi:hypothetical protein